MIFEMVSSQLHSQWIHCFRSLWDNYQMLLHVAFSYTLFKLVQTLRVAKEMLPFSLIASL